MSDGRAAGGIRRATARDDASGRATTRRATARVVADRSTRAMIKLFSVKEKQQKEAAERAASGGSASRQSSGEVRVAKDISELALPRTMAISFPNGRDDLLNFVITIKPDEGYYRGGVFEFSFAVPTVYPHEPPKVRCECKVYHPNIDLDGNVCLNILREDWKPVLSISSVIFGLSLLFSEPNPDDPLNKEAAEDLARTPKNFELNVRRAMQGGYVGSHRFSHCLR